MEFDFSILKPQERASLRLRALYEQAGYRKFHMGRFEEYGLYQENRRFLTSDQVITFTDLDGRLLALKPDVTLSIAKNAQPAPGQCEKYYYIENVYRPSLESHTYKEINQMGLECIGAVDEATTAQVLGLARQSLEALEAPAVLELSHMGFVTGLLDALNVAEQWRPELLELIKSKNAHQLRRTAQTAGVQPDGIEALCRLPGLSGPFAQVMEGAQELCRAVERLGGMEDWQRRRRWGASPRAGQAAMAAALDQLQTLWQALDGWTELQLDLSLTGDMEYYTGLVFQGYLAGLPRPVLKGGQYDLLAQKFCPGAGAIGFALYLDEMERLNAPLPPVQRASGSAMLNVALPKGRLGDKVYALLAAAGYGCEENYNETRKLVVENPAAGIRYFLVKPSDVAIYVEHGAADVGIVGKDILEESGADVYELLDTGLGKCRMCVAGPTDFTDDPSRALRVATKFVNIAKAYYSSLGRDIEIIKLNGSIELAPILGLSDVIVDIVETGTTLKENNLKVLTEFMPISARFIANKASYKFKNKELLTLMEKLQEGIEQ